MRLRSNLRLIGLLCMLLALIGCDRGAEDTAPSESPTPVVALGASTHAEAPSKPRPGQGSSVILGAIELPAADQLGDIPALLDFFEPGSSAAFQGSAMPWFTSLAGGNLDGADLKRPLRVFFANPAAFNDPMLLLVHVQDEGRLRAAVTRRSIDIRGKLALIGPADAVNASKDEIFKNYARTASPKKPRIVAYLPTILSNFRNDIQSFKQMAPAMIAGQSNQQITPRGVEVMLDTVMALAEQTDQLELTVSAQGNQAGISLRFVPLPGSTMAAINKTQKPSGFGLLQQLPAHAGSALVVAGDFDAKGMKPLMDLFNALAAEFLFPDNPKVLKLFNEWSSLSDGSFAIAASSMGAGGVDMEMAGLYGVTDTVKSQEVYAKLIQALVDSGPTDSFGIEQRYEFEVGKLTHNNAPIMLQTVHSDASKSPDAAAALGGKTKWTAYNYIASLKNRMVYVMTSKKDPTNIKAAIDALDGKGQVTLSTGAADALSASKARGESMFMFMDLGILSAGAGGMPPGMPSFMIVGLGFEKTDLTVYLGASK